MMKPSQTTKTDELNTLRKRQKFRYHDCPPLAKSEDWMGSDKVVEEVGGGGATLVSGRGGEGRAKRLTD